MTNQMPVKLRANWLYTAEKRKFQCEWFLPSSPPREIAGKQTVLEGHDGDISLVFLLRDTFPTVATKRSRQSWNRSRGRPTNTFFWGSLVRFWIKRIHLVKLLQCSSLSWKFFFLSSIGVLNSCQQDHGKCVYVEQISPFPNLGTVVARWKSISKL